MALVAEDNTINRELLAYILKDEFEIIEAVDGKETIDRITELGSAITIILLDIVMPNLNGYDVLEFIHENGFQQIPVLVMTGDSTEQSEEKALSMGAWDFVTKPYKTNVLMTRIRNAIARSKMNYINEIEHQAQHDMLTGLYNRSYFFKGANEIMQKYQKQMMAFVRLDIKQFALINSLWGEEGGNVLLKYISLILDKNFEKYPSCCYGRIESDVFCYLMPYEEQQCMDIIHLLKEQIASYRHDYIVEPVFGIYISQPENTFSVEDMYIRATAAAKSCKKNSLYYYNFYNAEYEKNILLEKRIVHDMQKALENEEFCVYFQPKYNASTKTPYGAEALVRWIHPKLGTISPASFIPIFEKNGFIGKLDYYVWDKTCQYIRKWIDMGIRTAPVSVNISRAEIANPNLVDDLVGLISKYNIPTYLLQLELTESAYIDHPELINGVIEKLHAAGFIVMMDDFGSGYSSLNTLKDIDVDMLKIDMKFLSDDGNNVKGKRILTSIICMARWIGLPVITEGVETEDQFEFLKHIGCEYIQGYYFSRPMPADEYESLIKEVIQVNADTNDISNADLFLPKTLRDRIYMDKATGVFNRRYLKEWLFLDMDDISEQRVPLAVVMLKIMKFDKIVNLYGEKYGNEILKKTCTVIAEFIRKKDEIIRYEHHKFIVILPECTEDIVVRKIQQIQEKLEYIGQNDKQYQFQGIRCGYSYTESFKKDNQFLKDMIDTANKGVE